MGVSQYTFIGAFLRIELPTKNVIKNKTIITITCCNETCEYFNKRVSGKFCKQCGHKNHEEVTIKEEVITTQLSAYDLMLDFGNEDIFFATEIQDKVVFLPNTKNPLTHVSICLSEDEMLDVPDSHVAIKTLVEDYAAFLQYLDEKSIKWYVDFKILTYYL